ncbi:MAG TPA: hypothetical protein VF322_05265 [Gammaproteobacteria bacterium]
MTLAVEGTTDAAVAKRLLQEAALQVGPEYVKNGKGTLDRALNGYNRAAHHAQWLVLRDLDQDAACAPDLRRTLLPAPAPRMRLHIAVRAVEAWLLADAESLSTFLSVPARRVPADPEALPDPKRALVDLARRSRRRAVREALVPAPGSTAKVGPGYTALLIDHVWNGWRPPIASARSPSLARLRAFLASLQS